MFPRLPRSCFPTLGIATVLAVGSASAARAETVTLPAAASIVGGAPFFSDVRAFNTSYGSPLVVTATYRCFIGNPCPGIPPAEVFTLEPRQSRAFDNIAASAFGAPNTAGGVEFDFDGAPGQLVVTSRLYSTSPTPTVGMFVPGLDARAAHAASVLSSIRNGGDGAGFRTNVGAFNPGDAAVSVTFAIRDALGAARGQPVARTVAPHSGVQVSGIFGAAGAAGFATDNAVITVSASGPVFSYAAVIDNATTDPVFVVGANDGPGATPTNTGTPSSGPSPTRTPTPPLPTPTPSVTRTRTSTRTPTRTPGPTRLVYVGLNGMNFVDATTGNSTTTIPAGTTVEWRWVDGEHSTTSGACDATDCVPDDRWNSQKQKPAFTFTHAFNAMGTFPYYCMNHKVTMQGTVVVGAAAP